MMKVLSVLVVLLGGLLGRCNDVDVESVALKALRFSSKFDEPLRVIIILQDGMPSDVAAESVASISSNDGVRLTPYKHFPLVLAELPAEASLESVVDYLELVSQLDFVEGVEEDSLITLPESSFGIGDRSIITPSGVTPDDPLYDIQWGMSDMNMEEAWDITTGEGLKTRVVIIDTGVDYTHEDLVDNIWVNEMELNGVEGVDDDGNGYVDDIHGWNAVTNTGDPMDDHAHGSHCAGTIAATTNNTVGISGIHWDAEIVGCKFLKQDGTGSASNAITCVDYSLAVGAVVSSNSWGSRAYSNAMRIAIEVAKDRGQLFVAAAGNSGLNTDVFPHYPSTYNVANIISVAALTSTNELAPWSNYGFDSVHIAAPGADIASTVPSGYAYMSGTSMAAPQVAGVAALMLAIRPEWSYEEVKFVLRETVAPFRRGCKVLWEGKINALAAMQLCIATAAPPQAP